MKKVIIAIVIVALVAIGGVGYYLFTKNDDTNSSTNSTSQTNTQNKQKVNEEETKAEPLTVDSAITKMKDAGLTVGEKTGAYYQMIGASNGDKVDVNGTNVELYEFKTKDEATTADKQLTDDSSTVFSIDSFVVLVHSTDTTAVDTIKNALQ
jgi:uncharacterized protein YxeA